mmetsp:Transcript_10421/g.27601  ORF Transcript_10421/g.27601 Transcript_10421/m.27601 type:complete len:354 (-) Transcript_10421:31-1092(-)
MGKKNRKKQDDGDYFASLGAPTKNAVDDAAAERAEEERLAKQAKAAAQREAKKQKEAQERAERAAVAERARLAMERRNNKGRSVAVEEAEEEEAVEEPAPAPQPTAAEEAAPPPPPLSAFARVLLFLRPFSPDAGAVSGVGKVWRLLWVLLATFASPATIEDVDTHLRTSNSEAAEKIDAEDERKRTTMLFCPDTGKWFPRNTKVWSLASLRRTDTQIERWVKNLKTKGSKEQWTRVKDGDGWASCPSKLGVADEDLGDSEVSFYACLDGKVFECSEWISSHVCTRAAARELSCVDGPRTLFRVAVDDVQGAVATLDKKASAALSQKAGVAKAPKKEKLSRAEKKAKKKAYGR